MQKNIFEIGFISETLKPIIIDEKRNTNYYV